MKRRRKIKEFPKAVGLRIRARREELGISREALAELTDTSDSSIGNYERGENLPRRATLERIASVLGVRITDLTDPEEPQREHARGFAEAPAVAYVAGQEGFPSDLAEAFRRLYSAVMDAESTARVSFDEQHRRSLHGER